MKGGKNGQNGTKKGAGSPSLWRRIRRQARAHRATFFVYAALRLTVLAALVFAVAAGHWTTAFFCVLTLLLFLAPFLAEEAFRIELPSALEIVILLFIFCSEMLGEAAAFYVNVPLWDSLLHLVNGFLCAAVGFALAELMNRRRRKPNLSPLFLAVVAFSFSMTVGALWEFFEFFMDAVFHTDMQKDFLVDAVRSVLLDESRKNIVVSVENIARTVLYDAEGNVLADITLTQTFSYSDEYDAIRDAQDGADFLASLAQSGGGAVITDPVEIFATFEKFLRKTTNPALPFLIVIMVCILLDIAVRKFKFKWLHEIIRDKKAMKELNDTNTKAQGEK